MYPFLMLRILLLNIFLINILENTNNNLQFSAREEDKDILYTFIYFKYNDLNSNIVLLLVYY